MRKKGFTILELTIVLIVMVVLIAIAVFSYKGYVAKARSGEAIVNIGAIKKGEEAYKIQSGTYVNAENADRINELLSVGIRPKFYEYIVVGATTDNFLVVAKLIGEDLSSYAGTGLLPSGEAVIAMDNSGIVNSASLFATTGGLGTSGGGTSSGTGGWGSIGGLTSWVGGGGCGGGSGGSSGGGGGVGGMSVASYTSGGSGFTIPPNDPIPTVFNVTIQEMEDMLRNITTPFVFDSAGTAYQDGAYFYSLIGTYNITVEYGDLGSEGAIARFCRPGELGAGSSPQIIFDSSYQTEPGWPSESLTCVLLHELVHADIYYNTATWVNTYLSYGWRKEDGTLVTAADIIETSTESFPGHIRESVHQEFFTNWAEGQGWIDEDGRGKYNGVVPDDYTIYTPLEGGYLATTTTTGVGFENEKQTRYELGEDSVLAYLEATYGAQGYPDF